MKSIFILLLTVSLFVECLPVKTVEYIDGYEIIAGKHKSKKEKKHFTKFKVSNRGNYPIMVKFLKSTFDDVFEFDRKIYVKSKIVNITEMEQELVFYFSKDQEKYISPLNGLQRKELPKYDHGYGIEGESILLEGQSYFFMEVIVKDDKELDYLSSKSIRRNEVIDYLQELMLAYNKFQKNYIHLE